LEMPVPSFARRMRAAAVPAYRGSAAKSGRSECRAFLVKML
jgi:hypothetical protein